MSVVERSNFIDGEWVVGVRLAENLNPAQLSDLIGLYAEGSPRQMRQAVEAAKRATDSWRRTNPQVRADLLRAVGEEMNRRSEELGLLLCREVGRPYPECLAEIRRSAQIFHWFAGEALRVSGEFVQGLRPGYNIEVSRAPIGVVGVITAWNFPMCMPAWKIAAALAFGNCVVFKPSEFTPGCAWELTDMLRRAGVPAGVLNLVMGRGAEIGETLTDLVDAVSFTGSNAVGEAILQRSAKRMIKVQLELGGKNALVVLDNADLDLAVEAAVQSAFHASGQRCTAASRLVVHSAVHDDFVERLIRRMEQIRVGNPQSSGTEMGSLANAGQHEKVQRYIAIGRAEGATLVRGGDAPQGLSDGYWQNPALFVHTHNQMRINRDEIFGPVASVISVVDLDEAITVANDSDHALSSGIFTTSMRSAEEFRQRTRSGIIAINAPTAGVDYHVPFGGRSPSGYGGREQGRAAIEFFTETVTTYRNHGVI